MTLKSTVRPWSFSPSNHQVNSPPVPHSRTKIRLTWPQLKLSKQRARMNFDVCLQWKAEWCSIASHLCYHQCLRCQPLLTLCLLATHRQHRISSSTLWKTKRLSGLTTLVTFPWSVISERVSPHYKNQRRLRSLVFVIYNFKIILFASSTRHTAQYGTSVPSSPRKRLTYVSFYLFFFSTKKLRKYSMLT